MMWLIKKYILGEFKKKIHTENHCNNTTLKKYIFIKQLYIS